MEPHTPASDADLALFGDNLTLADLAVPQRIDLMLMKTVDNDALNADSRTVYFVANREFRGGGSKFQHNDTPMARACITPCLENRKIARYHVDDTSGIAHGSTEFIVIRERPNVTPSVFAYYLTRWERVRNFAIEQMTGTSGRQCVPTTSLDHLVIHLPSLKE